MPVTVTIVEEFPIAGGAISAALRQDPRIEILEICPDATSVLDVLVIREPTVVLLDLQLPDLDGPQLIGRIRRLHPNVRVAVYSASERSARVLSAMHAGANAYMVKRQGAREVADGLVAVAEGGTVLAPQVALSVLIPRANQAEEARKARVRLEPTDAEIVRMVVSGDTDETIAKALFLSPRTVQNRLTRIRRIAHVQRRTELARWALENELI